MTFDTHGLSHRFARDQIDIGKLRAATSIVQIASFVTTLSPAEASFVGPCPFHHQHTPTFHVDEESGRYSCSACGRSGDVISLVQGIGGRRWMESCEWLTASEWTCPAEEREAAMAALADRQAAVHWAKKIYRGAAPVGGTASEALLAEQGFAGHVPLCIRHAEAPPPHLRHVASAPTSAALIAGVQDVDGSVTGIAHIRQRAARMRPEPLASFGQVSGCAIRFGPLAAELTLTVGIGNGLALSRLNPGASVWSAVRPMDLALIELPDEVRHVILASDRGDVGRRHASIARRALERRGLTVATRFPQAGASFRDEMLIGRR